MRSLLIFVLISNAAMAQITAVKQKALNSYVDYANQSAREVTTVVESIKSYYATLSQKKSWSTPRYTCPVQPDSYYLTNAQTLGKSLNTPALNTALTELSSAADAIDKRCKDLDTYYKLQDFKQDNHSKGEAIVNELPALLKEYQQKQFTLQQTLESVYQKLASTGVEPSYRKADLAMRQQILKERDVINSWTLNINESVHTGWPVSKLSESILQTDEQLATMKTFKPALKYPASSMWSSFQESLASILEEKRRSMDEYNFDAKKSDKHSNDAYLNLINYYNGTLVSNYNTFIQFAERDNYYGLKFIQFFPLFEIRSNSATVMVNVQPFATVPETIYSLPVHSAPIQKPVYTSLSNYLEFVNETWRQVRYMQMVLKSFNSTASFYKSLDSYEKRGPLNFDYQDYKVPLSYFQKATAGSKALPADIAASLNGRAEVLLNILKEMDDHAASIEQDVKEKKYEADHLEKIYSHLERSRLLMEIWDDKKEQLYQEVRKVFESYPPANRANSWYVSGTELQTLIDLDHDALFAAKKFYREDTTVTVTTESIDVALRNVIAKEYDNMKGIEKLGRYNGRCPYTPYEDIPETSRLLSEKLKKLKPANDHYGRHPYESLIYLYNEIAEDYNAFCELSPEVLLLKTVYQPELFSVKYPDSDKPKKNPTTSTNEPVTHQPLPTESKPTNTAKDVNLKTVIRDTVYIEKRDTIYLTDNNEALRSMEGYASNNLVLLLDVSGSMNSEEKLPLLKQSVLNMLSMMRQEDEVSVVIFSGKAKVLLKPVSFKEVDKIRNAIDELTSSGKTDANAGIKLAFKVANDNYIRGGNNRIILATDGEFPVSEETRKLIANYASEDIYLSIFNFGKNQGSAKTLGTLAELGKGNYEYVSRENVELKLIKEAKGKKKR